MTEPVVYKMIFPDNTFYIGSSKRFEHRVKDHINTMKRNQHDNFNVQESFNTNKTEPNFEILEITEKDKLIEAEQRHLDKNFNDILCLNIGSDARSPRKGIPTKPPSDEYRIMMSEKMKNRVFTQEHRERISLAKKGVKPTTPMSEETKRKMSESQKGKVISEEAKRKISETLMGHPPATAKPVVMINTGQVFPSALEAERKLNISGVSRGCNKGYSVGKMLDGTPMQWKYI